jgi:transposase-like protein
LDNLCWGTVKEDRQDMRRHGRLHFGISHHTAKMTDEDARRAIVLCEEKGLSRSKVAERFGVSPSSITQILHRWGRWKNL